MTIQDIVTAISTVGFPIVACVVMFKQNNDLHKTLTDISGTMTLLTERIKDIERKLDVKEDRDDN